jgi:hypothetical protein
MTKHERGFQFELPLKEPIMPIAIARKKIKSGYTQPLSRTVTNPTHKNEGPRQPIEKPVVQI